MQVNCYQKYIFSCSTSCITVSGASVLSQKVRKGVFQTNSKTTPLPVLPSTSVSLSVSLFYSLTQLCYCLSLSQLSINHLWGPYGWGITLVAKFLLNVTWHLYRSAVHMRTNAPPPQKHRFYREHLAAMVTLGFNGVSCRIMGYKNDAGAKRRARVTSASLMFYNLV